MKWIRDTRAWLCALLALALLGGAGMAEDVDDPVVVRVGTFSYTRSMLQKSLDSQLELSQMLSNEHQSCIWKAKKFLHDPSSKNQKDPLYVYI